MLPCICGSAAVWIVTTVLLTFACGDAGPLDRTPFPFRSAPSDQDTITAPSPPRGFPSYEAQFTDFIARAVADGSLRKSLSYPHLLPIGSYASVNEQAEEPLEWGLYSAQRSALEVLRTYELAPAELIITDLARDANLLVMTKAHTKPEHRSAPAVCSLTYTPSATVT
ncbi:hypothetical protein CLV84_1438 [Neolewinella xylanilytica]|uniref:Uncharacterized protein n=1 Tax=Neolewinella xylanilytica TaxID=1514080 RepID=A0A2S6IAE5_9BACT|nr:hypothetical protein [Neolewinella xylanilytica]PPK88470.1 hypothetical protein CLV84_1438 [Neolewinella xylanilytica]